MYLKQMRRKHSAMAHKRLRVRFSFSNFDPSKLITTKAFISIRIMGKIYLALESFAVTFQLNRNDSIAIK